jgi:hypothetical protein
MKYGYVRLQKPLIFFSLLGAVINESESESESEGIAIFFSSTNLYYWDCKIIGNPATDFNVNPATDCTSLLLEKYLSTSVISFQRVSVPVYYW